MYLSFTPANSDLVTRIYRYRYDLQLECLMVNQLSGILRASVHELSGKDLVVFFVNSVGKYLVVLSKQKDL